VFLERLMRRNFGFLISLAAVVIFWTLVQNVTWMFYYNQFDTVGVIWGKWNTPVGVLETVIEAALLVTLMRLAGKYVMSVGSRVAGLLLAAALFAVVSFLVPIIPQAIADASMQVTDPTTWSSLHLRGLSRADVFGYLTASIAVLALEVGRRTFEGWRSAQSDEADVAYGNAYDPH
jgi:hypothetical protein